MLKCTVKIEYDPVTDDYILPLTDEMVDALDVESGDEILWIDNNDGSWTLKKVQRAV